MSVKIFDNYLFVITGSKVILCGFMLRDCRLARHTSSHCWIRVVPHIFYVCRSSFVIIDCQPSINLSNETLSNFEFYIMMGLTWLVTSCPVNLELILYFMLIVGCLSGGNLLHIFYRVLNPTSIQSEAFQLVVIYKLLVPVTQCSYRRYSQLIRCIQASIYTYK